MHRRHRDADVCEGIPSFSMLSSRFPGHSCLRFKIQHITEEQAPLVNFCRTVSLHLVIISIWSAVSTAAAPGCLPEAQLVCNICSCPSRHITTCCYGS